MCAILILSVKRSHLTLDEPQHSGFGPTGSGTLVISGGQVTRKVVDEICNLQSP